MTDRKQTWMRTKDFEELHKEKFRWKCDTWGSIMSIAVESIKMRTPPKER